MQTTHGAPAHSTLPKPVEFVPRPGTPSPPAAEKKFALEEIGAYIAIRDGLLEEAEKSPNSELLRRVSTANDFVEACLQPARSPYEAQFLPEIDAARERSRCAAVKARISQIATRH